MYGKKGEIVASLPVDGCETSNSLPRSPLIRSEKAGMPRYCQVKMDAQGVPKSLLEEFSVVFI